MNDTPIQSRSGRYRPTIPNGASRSCDPIPTKARPSSGAHRRHLHDPPSGDDTGYGRGSLRLSAIMEIRVIYIFTHDSIGVGEDGLTHQSVEQLASLRAIPGLTDIRPCDANEVTEAWRAIMEIKREPVVLILSRQALPTLDRSKFAPASGLR